MKLSVVLANKILIH